MSLILLSVFHHPVAVVGDQRIMSHFLCTELVVHVSLYELLTSFVVELFSRPTYVCMCHMNYVVPAP